MKKVIFIAFSVLLLGAVWLYSDLWLDMQDQKQVNQDLRADRTALEAELEDQTDRLRQRQERLESARGEIERLKEELEQAQKPVVMPLSHKEPDASVRFVEEAVPMTFLPGPDQAVLRDLDAGSLVNVIQETTHLESGAVYLYVEAQNYADPVMERGYILKESATYFTPDLEEQVVDPLHLEAGTTVWEEADNPDAGYELQDRTQVYLIERDAGVAMLGSFGGLVLYAQEDDIVYPQSDIR